LLAIQTELGFGFELGDLSEIEKLANVEKVEFF
jgi:hypothetical protein